MALSTLPVGVIEQHKANSKESGADKPVPAGVAEVCGEQAAIEHCGHSKHVPTNRMVPHRAVMPQALAAGRLVWHDAPGCPAA